MNRSVLLQGNMSMLDRFPLAAAIFFACSVKGLAAQTGGGEPRSHPGWSLARTMREFADAPWPGRGFFSARGSWRWVQTTREPDGRVHMEVRRVSAARTDALAGGEGSGPLSELFGRSGIFALGPAVSAEGKWRRVGDRFVPPGAGASSPSFVEWRREGRRWVISSLGAWVTIEPHVAGTPIDEAIPATDHRGEPLHLPLPANGRYAAGQPWYEGAEPIIVAGTAS